MLQVLGFLDVIKSYVEVPRTESSGAKQDGMAEARREHEPVKKDQTPLTGSSGAEQAAAAAVPRTGTCRDKWQPGAPDWIIRGWQPVRTKAGLDRPR